MRSGDFLNRDALQQFSTLSALAQIRRPKRFEVISRRDTRLHARAIRSHDERVPSKPQLFSLRLIALMFISITSHWMKPVAFSSKGETTMNMLIKTLAAASFVVTAVAGSTGTVQAQSQAYAQQMPPSSQPMQPGEWSGRSIARTGATVPNPGTAKIGPQTEVERRAQERSDRAIRTICIGCL